MACEIRAAGFGGPLGLADDERGGGDVRNRVLVAGADPGLSEEIRGLGARGVAAIARTFLARASVANADPQLLVTVRSLPGALLPLPEDEATWSARCDGGEAEVLRGEKERWATRRLRALSAWWTDAILATHHWVAMRSQVPDAIWGAT